MKDRPARRRLLRRSRLAQRIALVLVITSLAAGGYWLERTVTRLRAYPEQAGRGASVTVEVPRGASFPRVLALLVEAGVIPEDESLLFKLLVLHRGVAGKVTAGEHHFRGEMTPDEVIAELLRPQPARERRVTIPEGRNILEVAAILSAAGYGAPAELLAAMRAPELLRELEIAGESAEGYLFPDTYMFPAKATPEQLIRRMVARHRQVYAGLARQHRDGAEELRKGLGWGDREVVIMASIVEKETGARHERPLIAGVFLNRLRSPTFQPKRLETDPTIIYGCTALLERSAACEQFEGRIRRIHLRDPENPYNTYTHEGLPPGPITNPGKEALAAVLAPKKSRFLYFVARNDGTHQFSKNLAEHEAAVEKFMRQGAVGDGSAAGAVDPGEP